jgi:hypothetical protein
MRTRAPLPRAVAGGWPWGALPLPSPSRVWGSECAPIGTASSPKMVVRRRSAFAMVERHHGLLKPSIQL